VKDAGEFNPDPDLVYSLPPQVRQAIAAIPSHSPELGDLDMSFNGNSEVKQWNRRDHSQAQLRALVPSVQQRRKQMSEFDEYYDEDGRKKDPNQITPEDVADYQQNMQRGQHLQNLSNAQTYQQRLQQLQADPAMQRACKDAKITIEELASAEINHQAGSQYIVGHMTRASYPGYVKEMKNVIAGKQPFLKQPHDPLMPEPAAKIAPDTFSDMQAVREAQKRGEITSEQANERIMALGIGPKR
jgi:hypothetical protein